MKKATIKIRSIISLALSSVIALGGLIIPIYPQQLRPVVISFGQPNIWSLEQAHYLLARMHRQNLDLQTATLGDLDPNATNASRIDILKVLLEAGVKYDQAVALNNQLLKSDKNFNSSRRQELLTTRSGLQAESTQLARDIAALKIAKAAAKGDEADSIQAQVDAKTEAKAAVDNQLGQVNTELQGLSSATGNFTSAEPSGSFNSDNLKGDLDALINKVQLINPSIAATLRLDNHIQMQYEIIAKQLTLLRDEVGPGERLVFLELPQSINATQDKADNKIAQAWWRIAGYTRIDKKKRLEKELHELLLGIQQIDIEGKLTDELAAKNVGNREILASNLSELCSEKEVGEKNLANAQRRLAEITARKSDADQQFDQALKLHSDAVKALAEARDSGNQDRIKRALADRDKALGQVASAQEIKAKADKQNQAECPKLELNVAQAASVLKDTDNTINETRKAIQQIDDRQIKVRKERARLSQAFSSLSNKFQRLQVELKKSEIAEQRDVADRLLQGGGTRTSEVVAQTIKLLDGKLNLESANYLNDKEGVGGPHFAAQDGREYVNLDLFSSSSPRDKAMLRSGVGTSNGVAILKSRAVRTIDIIPRQNAINVNDTKQSVSKTGIFGAFSFLFGFAGKFTYERQREHAEQFLNQELFTSGFGKGESDFGWNFYPFAGTRVLAPGIRTTYAIAIIPQDAESLVLKARGCYFPRKENQPLNYDMAGTDDWTNREPKTRNCTAQEQVFILPVPGGSGDGGDYYVTGLRYSPHIESGSRMIASIYGQNLPAQAGVLVEGVPLRQAVGLGQVNVESILGDKSKEVCDGDICGRFERVDSNQIIISFKMPADYTGTPRISIIGPGKAIELNKLSLTVNGDEDSQLESSEWMFGIPPNNKSRKIADFKVAPAQGRPGESTGILSGSNFEGTDTIYVNGVVATPAPGTCRKDLCIVNFPQQSTDFLTVTVAPADAVQNAVSRTVVNPINLSIISATVVSSVPADASRPAVLTLKLDGSGFKESLEIKVVKADGSKEEPQKIIPSAGQMILKVVSPDAAVQITVRDPDNNRLVSTVVVRPADPPKQKDN